MAKTTKGKIRREIFGDGRESGPRWVEREQGIRKQTKTKIKRAKKNRKGLLGLIRKL